MSETGKKPQDYRLPHEEWRPYQRETIAWLETVDKPVALVEAPTGSGKTSFAAALSRSEPVISLVRTKALQEINYGQTYGADVLYGRGNYACVHPDALDGATGDDCLYEQAMIECDCADACPYLQARSIAQNSPFASLNYAYYLTSRWPRKSSARLVLDEGHQLSDTVLDWAGCTLTERDVEKWGLPTQPVIGLTVPRRVAISLAIQWLSVAQGVLLGHLPKYKSPDADVRQKRRALEAVIHKVSNTLSALEVSGDDWYIVSGVEQTQAKRGGRRFIARPLTARHHFPVYFNKRCVVMTATMGDFATFARELGIAEYASVRVPSQWSPEVRRVRVLDAPKMNWKSEHKDYWQQALVIAQAVNSVPRDWSGIVHTASMAQAQRLYGLLCQHGLEKRMYLDMFNTGTDTAIMTWQKHRDQGIRQGQGPIAVSWRMGEGYDGTVEKICISAKVPFPNTGDEYEKRRLDYDLRFYLQRTAWALEQALGRTRRGRAEDYGEENGLVAIADSNWTRVKSFLSESFREAVQM